MTYRPGRTRSSRFRAGCRRRCSLGSAWRSWSRGLHCTSGSPRAVRRGGGGSPSLLVGIGLALVVEGAALHVWISSRSPAWAWTIRALNAATPVWLWRDHRARAAAVLTLGDREVVVTLGHQLHCRFPRSAGAGAGGAETATWRSVPAPDMVRDYVNTAKPLEPNVMLAFREPVEARLPLGIR